MKKTVLLLTNTNDGIHTDIVAKKLTEKGAQNFRLNIDEIASGKCEVSFSISNNLFDLCLINGDQKIKREEITSIWYRRPNFYTPPIDDPIQREHTVKEIDSFLEGLWLTFSDVFWLNNPLYLEAARKKINQLKVAKDVGFFIPNSLVTNNPDQVKKFYEQNSGKIIFKTMGGEFLDFGDKFYNIPTTLIEKMHLENLALIEKCPSLFQRCIDKKYELRVTVVGDKFFPVKIFSQDNELSKIDWRHPDLIQSLKYELVELPEFIRNKCLEMMSRLGIIFCAFDFAVDSQGSYWFFEVNSNPQWYWLEDITGALISDAIVDKLLVR